jgi:calcineurin-like phosphoesterase family protein
MSQFNLVMFSGEVIDKQEFGKTRKIKVRHEIDYKSFTEQQEHEIVCFDNSFDEINIGDNIFMVGKLRNNKDKNGRLWSQIQAKQITKIEINSDSIPF